MTDIDIDIDALKALADRVLRAAKRRQEAAADPAIDWREYDRLAQEADDDQAALIHNVGAQTLVLLLDRIRSLEHTAGAAGRALREAQERIAEVERERDANRDEATKLRGWFDSEAQAAGRLQREADTLRAERDAMAALLGECRNECEMWTPDESLATADGSEALNGWYALRDRIDAATNKEKQR